MPSKGGEKSTHNLVKKLNEIQSEKIYMLTSNMKIN